jgi:PhnB protein
MIRNLHPRLVVADAPAAIEFYVNVLGATEEQRHTHDGKVVNAALALAGTAFAVKDEGHGDPSPDTLGGTTVVFTLTVDDPDALVADAVSAGATVVYPVTDHEYGRAGRIQDPWGHQWMVWGTASQG